MKFLQRLKDHFSKSRQLRQMGLLARVKNILRKPQHFLVIVAFEDASIRSIYLNYLMMLAVVPALCGLIGMHFFGIGIPFSSTTIPFLFALLMSLVCYVLTLAMIFVFAVALKALSARHEGQGDLLAAFKLAAYASTPMLLGGVFGLVPALSVLSFAGALYGARLVRMGLPILMKVPHDKAERCAKYLLPLTMVAGASLFFCLTLSASLFGEQTNRLDQDSEAYIVLDTYKKPDMPSPAARAPQHAQPPPQMLQRLPHDPFSPSLLKTFLPERLGPFSRTSLHESRLTGEMPVSVGLANYDDGGHQKLSVTIVDTAYLLDETLPPNKETETTIETAWRKRHRTHYLKFDKLGAHAEYKIVLGNGTSVTLEGTRISGDLLQALSLKLDLSRLENQQRP